MRSSDCRGLVLVCPRLLSKRQYIAHYMNFEGMSRQEATDQWDLDLGNEQILKEEENGELKVWVRETTRVLGERGMERSRSLEHTPRLLTYQDADDA